MKKLILFIPLLLSLISCNDKQDAFSYSNSINDNSYYSNMTFSKYEPFIVDGKDYKWTILTQEEGSLLIYSVEKVEVKYNISFDKYKIVYVTNIPKGIAYLFDYDGYRYLLAVGI